MKKQKSLPTGVFAHKPEKIQEPSEGRPRYSKPSSVPRDPGWRDMTHGFNPDFDYHAAAREMKRIRELI